MVSDCALSSQQPECGHVIYFLLIALLLVHEEVKVVIAALILQTTFAAVCDYRP